MKQSYQRLILSELEERKRRNVNFSLRSFARYLEMSPGHLSSIVHGRKSLTRKQALKLADKLTLSPSVRAEFLSSTFPELNGNDDGQAEIRLLKEDEFNLISDWYHFAILSLGSLTKNKANPKWIAKHLSISELQATDAFARLQRLKLVTVARDGCFSQTDKPLATTDDISSIAIRKYHRQILELASQKLDLVPVELREFQAITISIDPKNLNNFKKLIRKFKSEINREASSGKKKVVYKMAIQLFPVSKNEE